MKKSVLLALAALAFGGATATAQQAVTYEPDCSQGYLENRNRDNWFITAEGGTSFLMEKRDINAPLKDRFGGAAALYLGKWVSPVFGFRFGANWIMPKGATTADGLYRKMNAEPWDNGFYPKKFMGLGPEFDVLIDITNWWCGYKPDRVYNFILHGGAGGYWTWKRSYNGQPEIGWHRAHNTIMFANAGFMNNFRLSKVVDLFIDVQYTLIDFKPGATHLLSGQVGFNFNLGRSEWECPVVPVLVPQRYTDADYEALEAKLNTKVKENKQLEDEIENCMKTCKKAKVVDCEGLVTIYYPINQYGLAAREKTVLKSVAEVMKNSDKRYVLTGYADSYTGTDAINDRLREARVDGVYNYLISQGVDAAKLDKTTNANNLTDLGPDAAPLDRAVTIRYAE